MRQRSSLFDFPLKRKDTTAAEKLGKEILLVLSGYVRML